MRVCYGFKERRIPFDPGPSPTTISCAAWHVNHPSWKSSRVLSSCGVFHLVYAAFLLLWRQWRKVFSSRGSFLILFTPRSYFSVGDGGRCRRRSWPSVRKSTRAPPSKSAGYGSTRVRRSSRTRRRATSSPASGIRTST